MMSIALCSASRPPVFGLLHDEPVLSFVPITRAGSCSAREETSQGGSEQEFERLDDAVRLPFG